MTPLDDTLSRLAREFSVADIMTSASSLTYAKDEDQAKELLNRFPDFDVIPILTAKGLSDYVERGSSVARRIEVGDLGSEGTSIVDALDILKCRPWVFVLVGDRVGGYVHYSDLNRPIVKLPLFVLFEAVERQLFERLGSRVSPDFLRTIVSVTHLEALSQKMGKLQLKRANLNWASLLSFRELLVCAMKLEVLPLGRETIESLARVRNIVSHAASSMLVEKPSDVVQLADAKQACVDILNASTEFSSS